MTYRGRPPGLRSCNRSPRQGTRNLVHGEVQQVFEILKNEKVCEMQTADTLLGIIHDRVSTIRTKDTGEPDARKRARPVCAVRHFEIFLSQTGGTRERFLSYQLTRRRKPNGTTACWESGACLKAL